MRIILTRSKEDNKNFDKLLEEELKANIIDFPCIEFKAPEDNYEALDWAIRKNNTYNWLFLLSKKAAEVFFERLLAIGGGLRNLDQQLKIACIGKSTKEYVENTIGFPVDFCPSKYNSDALLSEFKAKVLKNSDALGMKVLIPRTNVADDQIKDELFKSKVEVEEVNSYISGCPDFLDDSKDYYLGKSNEIKESIEAGKNVILLLTSSEITRNFKKMNDKLNPELDYSKLKIFSIGPKTSATIKELFPDSQLVEAENSTLAGLIESVLKS